MAALEGSPTVSVRAVRPPVEPKTLVLVFSGVITRAGIPDLCGRVRVLLQGSEDPNILCDVGGCVDPDAVAVDALARLQLTARRLGRRFGLRNAPTELKDLVELMGLCDVLALEPERQTEERKESSGVEEEADPVDGTA